MNKIDIIKSYFGMTTKEAKNYIKNTDEKIILAIIEGFKKEAKKTFYND